MMNSMMLAQLMKDLQVGCFFRRVDRKREKETRERYQNTSAEISPRRGGGSSGIPVGLPKFRSSKNTDSEIQPTWNPLGFDSIGCHWIHHSDRRRFSNGKDRNSPRLENGMSIDGCAFRQDETRGDWVEILWSIALRNIIQCFVSHPMDCFCFDDFLSTLPRPQLDNATTTKIKQSINQLVF
jgi:hypothetical protein